MSKRNKYDEMAERLTDQRYCREDVTRLVAAELRKQGERIEKLEAVLRWYADSGCKGENMIVNRESGTLVSDMYDWGSRARAALKK